MPRYPRGQIQLIDELLDLVPDLEVQWDDLDGLSVYRTARLTSTAHKGLPDLINAVADERIAQSRFITNGVEITFVSDRRADDRKPFLAADAGFLLTKKRKPAKKAAAKKAAAPKDAE